MANGNTFYLAQRSALEFEDDEIDWLFGEIETGIDEAMRRGGLLYEYEPELVRAALDFFRRYHQRLELQQAKADFESVRLTDEEWGRRWGEKMRRICIDPTAKPDGVGKPPKSNE